MRQMRRLTIVWGLVLVLIFAALTAFGILWKHKYGVYSQLEKEISNAAKKYKDAATIEGDEVVKISLQELKDASLIDDFEVNDKECKGYVLIQKESMIYEYNGYIKCEEYTTEGYEE